MDLKELYSKWNSISLIVRILCGLAIGLVLALIIPGYSYISVFGEIFVSALKAIAFSRHRQTMRGKRQRPTAAM